MVLAVDLESMNPGVQVLEVKNSQSVKIESVKFDPRFENKQRLRMIFTNVVSSTLANLEVTETVQVMNIPLYFLVRSIWLQKYISFSMYLCALEHAIEFGTGINEENIGP